MNPMQLIQMLRGGNPQQMIVQMMRSQAGNNPIMKNALNMLENGDNKGIEELARNLCKEKGINPDDAVSQLKDQLGLNK